MVVISMENFTKFINLLKTTYPELKFKPGKRFAFRPPKTIIYVEGEKNFKLLVLHELGHALIGEFSFKTDVERLKIETKAWAKAKSLAKTFNIPFNETFAESELDSYRDWLHKKSLCKKCGLTRFQTPDGVYHCPHCEL